MLYLYFTGTNVQILTLRAAGAGSFELSLCAHLKEHSKKVQGRAKLGVQAYAEALLVIPTCWLPTLNPKLNPQP